MVNFYEGLLCFTMSLQNVLPFPRCLSPIQARVKLYAALRCVRMTLQNVPPFPGMTSEGGGAVAFPVMTLAFNIKPTIARDFSLMIQSCGMTAAAFTIFWMRVQLEWSSIVFCSLGGAVGTALGLEFVDPNLTPPQKKMGFVCIWFSFAFALFLLNRYHKRRTFKEIPDMKAWKAAVLVVTGVIGGIFTSVAGSGLDICSFSMLTLLFRVSEKTATPTSVVLMAGNTVVGFYWRQVSLSRTSKMLAVSYWWKLLWRSKGSQRQLFFEISVLRDTSLLGNMCVHRVRPIMGFFFRSLFF